MNIKSTLETKIPPPVYGLLTALLIWWLNQWLPAWALLPAALKIPGMVLMVGGFSLDLLALKQFTGKHTTLNPLSPEKASTIVISGIYRYTRNPMYLGLLIALSGWCFYLGNLAGFLCLPLFVLILTRMQILPEERILSDKFGEPYIDYLKQVRRWI